jgi:hypothetical protein
MMAQLKALSAFISSIPSVLKAFDEFQFLAAQKLMVFVSINQLCLRYKPFLQGLPASQPASQPASHTILKSEMTESQISDLGKTNPPKKAVSHQMFQPSLQSLLYLHIREKPLVKVKENFHVGYLRKLFFITVLAQLQLPFLIGGKSLIVFCARRGSPATRSTFAARIVRRGRIHIIDVIQRQTCPLSSKFKISPTEMMAMIHDSCSA